MHSAARLPHCSSRRGSLLAASLVGCLCPPLLGALAVCASTPGADCESRGLVAWIVAQLAIAVALAASGRTREVFVRAMLGQAAATTVMVFRFLRARLEPAANLDSTTLADALAFAALAGTCGGALVAVWQGTVASAVLRVRARPSHDALERALMAVSARLLAPSLLLGAFLVRREPELAASVTLGSALLLGVRVTCAIRRIALRRWLCRVDAGEIGGWRIVDAPAQWSRLHLDPVSATRAGERAGRRVLVAVAPACSPYREAERVRPVATVD